MNIITRRNFLAVSSLAGASVFANTGAKRVFKYAIIGCGGRGTGASQNLEDAAKWLGHEAKMVAAVDFFHDKAAKLAAKHDCPESRVFDGATGYLKALDTDAEIILLCTPPFFRPLQMERCIAAGKHVFAEKPIATDPPGVRKFLKAVDEAKRKKLFVLSGTCHRHNYRALRMIGPVQKGIAGEILGGVVYRCHGGMWERDRRPGESNAAYLANNWYNFREMSGDNLTEQAIHEVDLANWFIGRLPQRAMGVGARYRKHTGNGYNLLSVDFDYGKNLHIHAIARQLTGCWDKCCATLTGSIAQFDVLGSKLRKSDGTSIPFPYDEEAVKGIHENMMVNEHADLLKAMLADSYMNEGEHVALATAVPMMGTLATYSGRMVQLNDLLKNEASEFYNWKHSLQPEDFERGGDVELPQENTWVVPGKA